MNEKDWGYSIGGPIGKPGGNNKLFFFYAHEFMPRDHGRRHAFASASRPRSSAQATSRRRRDNNGNLYPYIKDPLLTGTCSASNQAACFADGGVLGRIPATVSTRRA